jgi:hypothetical protein
MKISAREPGVPRYPVAVRPANPSGDAVIQFHRDRSLSSGAFFWFFRSRCAQIAIRLSCRNGRALPILERSSPAYLYQ